MTHIFIEIGFVVILAVCITALIYLTPWALGGLAHIVVHQFQLGWESLP